MDFMKLLKSLEELLYELMVWAVFYPLTLWLTFRFPQRMMDYSDSELGDVTTEQYEDTISPPLFLMLSLAISYGVETLVPHPAAAQDSSLLSDPTNLLIFRVVTFSLFPLLHSLVMLNYSDAKLNRETLRLPFYSQCYVTAPFVMMLGLALTVSYLAIPYSGLIATGLALAITFWFMRQQALWFAARLGVGTGRGWFLTSTTMVAALVLMALAVVIIDKI